MENKTSRLLKMLDFDENDRLLIINVDDFGMCHSTVQTGLRTIIEGVATSCTVMTPCPWGDSALEALRGHPEIPFGVHLTLVSEHPVYRWGPLSEVSAVRSLTDEDGKFYAEDRMDELMATAELKEVETEWRAQIDRVLAKGLKPSHLDSHCNTHERRDDIFDMTLELAKEYNLALRVGDLRRESAVLAQGLPCPNRGVLDSFRMETATKVDELIKMLRELPSGLSEWAMHPATPNAELMAITDSWPVREADERFCMSEEAKTVIAEEGIKLLNYRDVVPYWQSR